MYNISKTEQKWQKYWADNAIFAALNPPFVGVSPLKAYVLDMFPYPSGAGLHVGHPKGYTATDVYTRYLKARGYNVLHPMGWDAFGLPAENYAVKTGQHPRKTTEENIAVFKRQIQELGLAYDWAREINTTDPEYYKWSQWIFSRLVERGLAYEADMAVNWCPALKCVLANEEVVDGKSEVGGHPVERRNMRQWVLRITQYAEELLADVDILDWPEGIKEQQRNWIGKSEGCEFSLRNSIDPSKSLAVYTTRVDTVYGMKWVVIAPDHPQVRDYITPAEAGKCADYIMMSKGKSDQDRTNDGKEKTGVFTGSYVVNPFSGESVPVWIADYVLGNYGTGAVMGVPAHDTRDYAFAQKYGFEVVQTVANYILYTGADAPRPEVETLERRVVDVILENTKGEFLILEESNPTGYKFIGGGIEERDTALETVFKETLEESGYSNIEIVWPVLGSFVYSHGYRHPKQKNQYAYGEFYHARLRSDVQVVSEIEEWRHKAHWVPREKVAEMLTWEAHKNAWKLFNEGFTPFLDDGKLVNSGEYDGMTSAEARTALMERAQNEGFGSKCINYKLRDWIFSRQRYWGEPMPVIHLNIEDLAKISQSITLEGTSVQGDTLYIDGTKYATVYPGLDGPYILETNLPLTLPEVAKYEPSDDGRSPLANVTDWVNIEVAPGLRGTRETNTMPQWAGSCWYYLRFMDPKNPDAIASKEAMEYWGNVDCYVGGAEHAVLHLLYARFWHKVLYDLEVVPTREPFQRLINQGLILGPDGNKMSKSKGNVVNPDEIVREYWADVLRTYILSMADFRDPAPWDTKSMVGMKRFLERCEGLFAERPRLAADEMKSMKLLHKTIKKVTSDIEAFKFNTAISALIILVNEGLPTDPEFQVEWRSAFARLLHPFAPHMAEELWERLGNTSSIYGAPWPEFDSFMIMDDEITIAIQVNGKLRGVREFLHWVAQEEVVAEAYNMPDIAKWTDGKIVVREIFIPNKLLNIVVKD